MEGLKEGQMLKRKVSLVGSKEELSSIGWSPKFHITRGITPPSKTKIFVSAHLEMDDCQTSEVRNACFVD